MGEEWSLLEKLKLLILNLLVPTGNSGWPFLLSLPVFSKCWLDSHLHPDFCKRKSLGEVVGIWKLWQQTLWLTCWWSCWQENLFIRKWRGWFPCAAISHKGGSSWPMRIRLPHKWYENICLMFSVVPEVDLPRTGWLLGSAVLVPCQENGNTVKQNLSTVWLYLTSVWTH